MKEELDRHSWMRLGELQILLIAAVVQGWALYGLHLAIKNAHWPATEPGWLFACYAIALFIPWTVQLISAHVRQRAAWVIVATLAAAYFYFGWHQGTQVMDLETEPLFNNDDWLPMTFVLGVQWLMLLPFLQLRLVHGRWAAPYQGLFDLAWRNHLALAEAGLFTGLFWLLLMLWQVLFSMLGIEFFRELFREPIFIYPVTTLVFGMALHLIGAIDRFSRVVLEQLLNVLKWLSLVAGIILALFTIALVFKLPGMIESGNKAIGAAWLLWLVAVIVLLVNAAFRDGTVAQPYPSWLGFPLRCLIPLVVIIALTGMYALYLRIDAHGLTVGRVWGCVVASAALLYAVGYSAAAVRPGAWMASIPRVNIVTALFLIAVTALAMTPVLSPYRLAANSQFDFALDYEQKQGANGYSTPFHYLRFNAGQYGLERLRELAAVEGHPRAESVRLVASEMLKRKEPWQPIPQANAEQWLAQIVLYPANATIDDDLKRILMSDPRSGDPLRNMPTDAQKVAGVFIDLDGDQDEDFVLIASPSAVLYERREEQWQFSATLETPHLGELKDLHERIRNGEVSAESPRWKELRIGKHVWRRNAWE